jgi:hypothetical protein
MRSLQLQAALESFIHEASACLGAELDAGAEIPFELEQQRDRRGSGGPSLYCYRPLTAEFIAERQIALEGLPAFAEVARLLCDFDGLDRYLASVGADIARLTPRGRLRAAVGSLLGGIFAEQSDFQVSEERVRDALGRLESTALSSTSDVTLVATLHGLTITSPELALTGGLTIARPDALDGLPPASLAGDASEPDHLVVVLSAEEGEPRKALERGTGILEDLLRALRLFGDGRVTLGSLAWARIGGGQWSPLAVGVGGRPHGMLVVTSEQEDELRAFCNLVSRRAPHGNEIAWALHRFEMGCARASVLEALSDNLLALRALLEPEGPASGLLAGRLAALCATPERRASLTERTMQALALERSTIAGTATAHAGASTLAGEVGEHLRALLRDVICGHLDPDLVGLADEMLLQAEESVAANVAELLEPVFSPTFAAPPSSEQLLGDPREAEEILDLLI